MCLLGPLQLILNDPERFEDPDDDGDDDGEGDGSHISSAVANGHQL